MQSEMIRAINAEDSLCSLCSLCSLWAAPNDLFARSKPTNVCRNMFATKPAVPTAAPVD